MDSQLKEWFQAKITSNPEYVKMHYFPALERVMDKAKSALHEANRKGTLEDIKLRQGWLDGVQETFDVLKGLHMSETRPAENGLISRTLDYVRQIRG